MFIDIKTDILIHKCLGCFFIIKSLLKKSFLCNFLNISDTEINIEIGVNTPSQ
jgi:hypothetical protein